MLAGVCGTDPFLLRDQFLRELRDLGFAGIQNFPTVGLIDGLFRENLEETGMSYRLEVELIAAARALDLLTTPYAFNPEEARMMAEAGADIVVAHMGLTTGGTIGRGRPGPWRSASPGCRPSPTPASRSAPTAWSSATAARSPRPRMRNSSSIVAWGSKGSTGQAAWSDCRRRPPSPNRSGDSRG